ncbi:MAG: hypothetical protein F9K29_07725 [Hyphomicrobiaceae bacterium]|nr:MAG: hypothetical protein F9K29_07725 [Hyphomicrobiaceae bacterium]
MLASLLIVATIGAGFAKGPWWFWLAAGAGLALLSITDPRNDRVSLAGSGVISARTLNNLVSLSAGCLTAALAFAIGRGIWWVMPA